MRKKILKKMLLVFIFGLIFSIPVISKAAPTGEGEGLVPCGATSKHSDMCNLCHLVVGVDNIVDYVLMVFAIIGFLMLVVGGITYIVSGGNQSIIGAAKKTIWSALVGFAIVLLAWVIINTVLLYLLPLSGNTIGEKLKAWSEFSCET
ncbi:MAG: hypothetical protein IPN70_03340 [Candidatus Moraniibacteriota bacterium]|nr:MAG: hypothetical protein IPN70_03340 [Candidatus Moranbacteria bacterium]